MTRARLVELDVVDSTQDEVRARLARAAPGEVVAVRARSQQAGRGREGRSWQDPPGAALLVSVGVRDVDAAVLDELPRRVIAALHGAITPAAATAWKAPNDLVCAETGAKVAGVLVDARTTGGRVDEVIVGAGCNLAGPAFATADERAATSLEQLGASLDVEAFVCAVEALLNEPRRA